MFPFLTDRHQQHVIFRRLTKFHRNRTTFSELWRHIDLLRRRPRHRNSTSGILFGNIVHFRKSKSICRPNFNEMPQSRPEILLFLFALKETAAILDFYFRFRFLPYHLIFILRLPNKFHPNRSTLSGLTTSHGFLCLRHGAGGILYSSLSVRELVIECVSLCVPKYLWTWYLKKQ